MCRVVIFAFIYCVVYAKTANIKKTTLTEQPPFLAWLVAPHGGELRYYCGASVLHDKFVLTAASCFNEKRDGNKTKVLVGPLNCQKTQLFDISTVIPHPKYSKKTRDYNKEINKCARQSHQSTGLKLRNKTIILDGPFNSQKTPQLFDISTVIPHPKYSNRIGDYNVAVVKLKKRMTLAGRVGRARVGRKVKVGSFVNVVGWEIDVNLTSPSIFHIAIMRVLNKRACVKALGGNVTITKRHGCAGVAEMGGACVTQTYEGSPVFSNTTLLGVTSHSPACGLTRYTALSTVKGWVTATLEDHLSYLDYLDEMVKDDDKDLL